MQERNDALMVPFREQHKARQSEQAGKKERGDKQADAPRPDKP